MLKKTFRLPVASMFVALAGAQTPQFQPGQLAVLRAGDGSLALKQKQAPAFVDQFSPDILNSHPSLSVAIPTNGPNTLFFNGQAATEGNLTRSDDRSSLSFAGYSGTNLLAVSGAPSGLSINRGFCVLDAFTNYTLVYNGNGWFPATNPRGVASDGTNNFWGAGGAGGTMYYDSATAAAPLAFETLPSTRAIKAINGVVYTSLKGSDSSAGYPAGVYDFVDTDSNLLPMPETPATYLNLVIQAQAPYTNNVGFDIDPSGTIAYLADDTAGIQKYVNTGGSWQFAYNFSIPQNIPASLNNSAGCFGIAVDFSGPAPVIYATTTEGFGGNVNSNRVVRIVDTNASASVTTVAQAPSVQIAYRGIDFTPDLRPLITSAPSSQSVVAGSNAAFNVSATSLSAAGYQWLQNGAVLQGQTSPMLVLDAVSVTANGNTYQCVVSNLYGSVTSSPPALLSVAANIAPPLISGAPQNFTNNVGDVVLLTAAVTGSPPLSYQWYLNGSPLSNQNEFGGATSNSLTINGAQLSDAGAYSLLVSNAAGSASNLVANLTVIYPLAVITEQPVSTTAFVGGEAVFNVTATGNPLAYQWYVGVAPSSLQPLADAGGTNGSQTPTLAITGVGFSNATNGSYYVVITDPGGSVTSAPAALSVLAFPPSSSAAYTAPEQIYSQHFDSLPIPDGSTFNSDNPVTITELTNIAPGQAGDVIYSLGDPFDFAYPVVPLGGQGGLGLGSTMPGWYGWAGVETKLGASAGDQTTGGIISFGEPYTGAAANNVTNRALGLLATSSTGPTALALKLVNETGSRLNSIDLSYLGELWRQQTRAQILAFGYTVDNTATNAFSTNVTASVPALDVSFPVSASGSAALDGTQPTNQVSLAVANLFIGDWAPGGVLWLVWTANDFAGGAQGLAIDDLVFSAGYNPLAELPDIASQPQSATVTNGAQASFTVSATSPYPFGYQWLFNQQTIAGATNAVLSLAKAGFASAGSYQVVLADSFGSVTSAPASLTVLTSAVPPSITVQPVSQTVFIGSNAVFTVAASGTGPLTYQWSAGPILLEDGGEVSGSQTATLTLTGVQVTDAAGYVAIVTGPGGVALSSPATLTVINPTATTFSFIPYTTPGAVYSQSFDSLPDPGVGTVNTANPVTIAGPTYSLGDPFDFGASVLASGDGGLGLSATMPGWYGLGAIAVKFGASAGDQSTGGVISFGPTNGVTANRALGLLATSSTGPTAFGARFLNTGTTTLNQFNLAFTGELWRQQPNSKTLAFGYFVDLFGTAGFTTNVTAFLPTLDVNFPTAALAAVDGTSPTNQTLVSVTNQAMADWPPGTALWLVWQMTNDAGNSQGLAIDNLSFSASTSQPTAPPTLSFQPGAGAIQLSWPVGPVTYTLQESSDLSQAGGWSAGGQPVSVIAGTNSVSVPAPAANTNLFFRLAY